MSEEKPTYDLAPDPDAQTTPPPPPPAAAAGGAGASTPPVARVAKIEAPPLVSDEVEDEFDAAEKAAAAPPAATAGEPKPQTFVRAGWDEPRYMLVLAGAAALGAGVMAWVNSPVPGVQPGFARLLLAIYTTGLHGGLGIVAVMVSAFLLGRPMGPMEFAAGRMLSAVGLFQLFVHLRLGSATAAEEIALGAAAYLGVLFATFRWKKEELGVVVASHFGLWLAMQVGMWLTGWVAASTRAASGG